MGKHRQIFDTDRSQRQIPIMAEAKTRTFTAPELAACKSLADAYYFTLRSSGRPRKVIEAETDIDASTMSRILSGTKNMPSDKAGAFYKACGNLYAFQWQAYQYGFDLTPRRLTDDEVIAQLQDEIAQLREAS